MNKSKLSLPKDKIKILLLEGVHKSSVDLFQQNGYNNIKYLSGALEKEELIKEVKDIHLIGIRSRSLITESVLKYANKLIAIGCFSIGTNQVNLNAAKLKGIPVFNAPFSNTRSVAELVISEAIFLLRKISEKNFAAHKGEWLKDASSSFEARGKVIGIIGYGHIGSQVSILAENFGMKVVYYDIEKKLNLGNAKPCNSLEELLAQSDIVTLHVPETPLTKSMISQKQINLMKKGASIINASRGSVVDLDALKDSLIKKHLSGAAIDVFPEEPSSNKERFVSALQGFENVILTPHIGGSTSEAQENIAIEVTEKLIKYSNVGSTLGATNFVEVSLAPNINTQRYLHIHENKPGILNKITKVFTTKKINIASQYLQTDPHIGYVILDINGKVNSTQILSELKSIRGTIKTRVLY